MLGFPFFLPKTRLTSVRRARKLQGSCWIKMLQIWTRTIGISMTSILIFSAVISFFIWQGWRVREAKIKRLLGNSQWYRARYCFMPSWKFSRQVKFFWSGKRCKKCGTRQRIDVHHLHYQILNRPILFWEFLFPWELRVLCRDCHSREHDG